ncbi:MAG: CoA-transferase [Anaerolineales bacterium]
MPRIRRGVLISAVESLSEHLEVTTELEFSADELICFCLARQVNDGDVVALGLATPLGAAAALLARKLHAPNIFIASAIATSVSIDPPELSLTDAEGRWIEAALTSSSFVTGAADYLPAVNPVEFFRPGQVDQYGNTNNISIGKDYRRPRLRMPGVGGVPDVSVFMSEMSLYVPRHSRVAFPKKLDFVSGLGHSEERRAGSGPKYLVSNLGQFDFPDGSMRLTHLHPGVSVDRVVAKTGFELAIADELQTTALPTGPELELLRLEVDPLGLRKLELLSGPERRGALRVIVEQDVSS